MNIKIAAFECKNLLVNKDIEWESDDFSTSASHCIDMCNKIIKGEVTNEKSHRWLGWIQACICCYGVASLEQLKLINKNS